MLFELVAGAHPVLQGTMPLTATIADEGILMPSASERMPELGPLAQIIDRCLSKKIDDPENDAVTVVCPADGLVIDTVHCPFTSVTPLSQLSGVVFVDDAPLLFVNDVDTV